MLTTQEHPQPFANPKNYVNQLIFQNLPICLSGFLMVSFLRMAKISGVAPLTILSSCPPKSFSVDLRPKGFKLMSHGCGPQAYEHP